MEHGAIPANPENLYGLRSRNATGHGRWRPFAQHLQPLIGGLAAAGRRLFDCRFSV